MNAENDPYKFSQIHWTPMALNDQQAERRFNGCSEPVRSWPKELKRAGAPSRRAGRGRR